MYWSRTGNVVDILVYFAISLGWVVGGWFSVSQSMRFHKREKFIAGISFGLLFYILISNGFAHFLPTYLAFVLASLAVLMLGLWLAGKPIHFPFRWNSRGVWFQIASLLIMTALFTLMMRGLGIGDDYAHLPLVSTMAAGDIPPHYSIFPSVFLPYHYGLDLLASSMVRVAGMFPWSAWDVSRAFVAGLTLLCGWLWFRRVTRSWVATTLSIILFAFGMGTRWLMTLLPSSWLANVSSAVQIIGSSSDTGHTLAEALFRPWQISGGPPIPIPYAFANGIFTPLIFNWGGSSSLPRLAIMLILLLSGRRSLKTNDVFLLVSASLSLALSAEHIFILINLGIGLASLIMIFRQGKGIRYRLLTFPGQFLLMLLVILALASVQGGVITELFRSYFTNIQGVGAAARSNFSLRWPPEFFDAHLGALSVLNWRQTIVLLAECGPVLLLFPLIVFRMHADLKHYRPVELGLGISTLLGVLIPTFVQYGVPRDIVRLTGFGLGAWVILAIQPLWSLFRRASFWRRAGIGLGYIITIFGGLVLFAYQSTAISRPQISDDFSSLDTRMSKAYWNQLDKQTVVFGPVGYRIQALFGRFSITQIDGRILDAFVPYLEEPDLYALYKLGVRYIYIDKNYWDSLGPGHQQALFLPCAHVMKRMEKYNSVTKELSDFRILIDIRACTQ